jgi:hypothetical protein
MNYNQVRVPYSEDPKKVLEKPSGPLIPPEYYVLEPWPTSPVSGDETMIRQHHH